MRDHQIREQLETIARRGPWGHVIRSVDPETKAVTIQRISFRAALNRLAQDYREKAFPMTPRADKGSRYVQYPLPNGKGLGPRFIVPA